MTRQNLLGIPPEVLAGLDGDQIAETRGPAALDRSIDRATPEELAARYRVALFLLNHRTDTRRTGKRAFEDFDRAEERAERTNDRSWAR